MKSETIEYNGMNYIALDSKVNGSCLGCHFFDTKDSEHCDAINDLVKERCNESDVIYVQIEKEKSNLKGKKLKLMIK